MDSIILAIVFMLSSVSFLLVLDKQNKHCRHLKLEKEEIMLENQVLYSNLKKLLLELEREALERGESKGYEEKYIIQKRRVKMYEKVHRNGGGMLL